MQIRFYINKLLLLLFLSLTASSITLHAQSNWRIKFFSDKDGLLQDKINCLHLDNKGFLWIGTDAGLSRFDGKVIKDFSHYYNEDQLTLGRCRNIFQIGETIFVNDDSNYFFIDDFSLNYRGKISNKAKTDLQLAIEKVNANPKLSNGTIKYTSSNSFVLNNYTFLAGHNSVGQLEFSRVVNNTKQPIKIFTLKDLSNETKLHNGRFFTCNGKVYLTCKEGLYSISFSNQQYLLANLLIDAKSLAPYVVNALAITPDERIILIGTDANKIVQFSNYKLVTAVYTQASILPKSIYDSIKAKQQSLNSDEWPVINQAYKIKGVQAYIKDNDGRVWMPTSAGLLVGSGSEIFSTATKNRYPRYWNFTKQDGLPSNEFIINKQNGYYFNKTNSLLYLPTSKGIVEIDTKQIEKAAGAYPPQITQVIIDNIELKRWSSDIEKFAQISLSASIPMEIESKNFEIEYRLMPTDSNWKKINDGKIFISRMMPGEQTIELRYNNGLTRTDYLYSRQALFFTPFWYESVWVRIGGILAIMGLLTGVYLFREYQLRKQNKKLNIRIEQKTIEVKRQMRKLKAVTQQNEMLIGVLAHDIKSPLRSISTLTTLLGGNVENANPEELSSHLREISKTSNKLSQFIGQFLVWYGQKSEKDVLTESVDVKLIIEEIIQYAVEMNINRNNKIDTSFDDSPIVINSNKQVLSIIIHNLLDNACKYTHKGKVTLSAHWRGRELWISCSDTGIGMSPETIDQLLKNESRVTPTMPDSYKLGYVFINGLIRQINARLAIESEIEKGSTISIAIKTRQS